MKFANKGKFKNYAQGAQQAICLAQMAQPPRGGPASHIAILCLVVDGTAGYMLGQAHLEEGAHLAIHLA